MKESPEVDLHGRPHGGLGAREDARLYHSRCSASALAQIFIDTGADADAGALLAAFDAPPRIPFEPFAALVCNFHVAFVRPAPAGCVSLPAGRALPVLSSPPAEDP